MFQLASMDPSWGSRAAARACFPRRAFGILRGNLCGPLLEDGFSKQIPSEIRRRGLAEGNVNSLRNMEIGHVYYLYLFIILHNVQIWLVNSINVPNLYMGISPLENMAV